MTKDKFKNKNGDLNNYSLACGYIQRVVINGYNIDLFSDGLYIVTVSDWSEVPRGANGRRELYESFDSLTSARKFWNEQKRQCKKGFLFTN